MKLGARTSRHSSRQGKRSSLSAVNRLDAAKVLVSYMSANGCTPNMVVYSVLLDGACECGQIDSAVAILEEMKSGDDQCAPNVVSYRCLIQCHCCVLLSDVVYGSLIVMLVFLPVKLAMRLAPSIFPLDVTVFDPFTEIPADVLLFQICIPFAIEHSKPWTTVRALLHQWFVAVGWAHGLTNFLLPRPEENNRRKNGNVEPARRDRLHDAHQVGVAQDNHLLMPTNY